MVVAERVFAAPGKLLLLGEYAVLEGAPALVTAADRFARVAVEPIQGDYHQLVARPLEAQPREFRLAEDRLEWRRSDGAERLWLVGAVLEALGPWAVDGGSLRLTLDTGAFHAPDGAKLGLGSSAALTTALAAAWFGVRHRAGALDRRRWLPLLVDLHRRLQDGRGSGADVAAAVHGGTLRYRAADGREPQAEPVTLPAELEFMWIWLGRSASTSDYLARMAAFRTSEPDLYRRHAGVLGELAEQGLAALAGGDSARFLEIVNAYGHAMDRLGAGANAPVYTVDHRRLAELADRAGVAFKPSGAGGGDIAMAVATDTQALGDLARRVTAAGYQLLEIGPGAPGVRELGDEGG